MDGKEAVQPEEHTKHLAHETAISRNPYSSWNWDFRIYRQLGYKHTFCQNVVSA